MDENVKENENGNENGNEEKKIDRIQQLFAFVVEDGATERIITSQAGHHLVMFVSAEDDKNMFKQMEETAQEASNETGKKISVIRFERGVVIKTFERKLVTTPTPTPAPTLVQP